MTAYGLALHAGSGSVATEVPQALPSSFYARSTEVVAKELLGHIVLSDVRGPRTSGCIIETEAYLGPHDPAGHGYRSRRTQRNDRLFGQPGIAYVYLSYGVHWCLNCVTERDGYPAAVLLRAIEPLYGVETMQRRRGTRRTLNLASGPGKLTQALGVTGRLNGHLLVRPPLRIIEGEGVGHEAIVTTPRIGVAKARDWPLRFVVRGSRFVSHASFEGRS